MSIVLKPLERATWRKVALLPLRRGQRRFVAPNVLSIAQAYVERGSEPRAAWLGDRPVGFVMFRREPEDGEWWINRLMVASRHQGKGYGRAILQAAIAEMAVRHDARRIFISWVPENAVAEALYLNCGFVKDGRVLYGEVVARLDLD